MKACWAWTSKNCRLCEGQGERRRRVQRVLLTETDTSASSSVFRIRSRPGRGTWVSCRRHRVSFGLLVKRGKTRLLSKYHLESLNYHEPTSCDSPKKLRTTSSPFPLRSPARTLVSESSPPLPSVALWMSVAKKHTEESTRGSKAARKAWQLSQLGARRRSRRALTRWPPRHMPVAAMRPLQLGSEVNRSTERVQSSSYPATSFSA